MTDAEFLALAAVQNKDPEARRLARKTLEVTRPAGCGNPSCARSAHSNQQWRLCDIARRKALDFDGTNDAQA